MQDSELNSLEEVSIEDLKSQLSEQEASEIDMRVLGNFILSEAKRINHEVTTAILTPISEWLDDEDWLKKFKDKEKINWADLKRKQREWTKLQRLLLSERKKQYWEAIRKKKQSREEVARILGTKSAKIESDPITPSIDLSHILTPFTPEKRYEEEVEQEFRKITKSYISSLIPYPQLLRCFLRNIQEIDFNSLPQFYPYDEKTDKIAKFQALLQMENDGQVELIQPDQSSEIYIRPCSIPTSLPITIKDRSGSSYHIDLTDLSEPQIKKVCSDAFNNRIICKS